MGTSKALLPWGNGGSVLGAVVATLRQGGAGRIVLVHREDDAKLERLAKELELERMTNPNPELGMLSSIWAGLDVLPALEDSLLVCPVDLPALQASTVEALAESLADGARLTLPVVGGVPGHPLGIGRDLVPAIRGLDLDRGLRQLVEMHPDEVVRVPVSDPGAVRDMDTPAAYRRLRRLTSEVPR